jgi:biopolymer transport protein ExbD
MEYLLKSVLCLLLLLLFHRLVLQQEVLYRFNRFFLLAAVLGSFLIPLVTLEVEQEVTIAPELSEVYSEGISRLDSFQEDVDMPVLEGETSNTAAVQLPWLEIGWSVYLIGLLVFLVRFLRNLRLIYQKIQRNYKVTYRNEILVLLPELGSPFSFLNYIFFSKSSFEKTGIPEAVFLHEQCHVREKHTWDILFIEALVVFFWFHPGLYIARQAIRLNHEFIADQQVIRRLPVSEYQSILLAILSGQQGFALGSPLNFSLTKKRFEMMKKTSKPGIQVLKLASLVGFLGIVVTLFAEKVAVSATTERKRETNEKLLSVEPQSISVQINANGEILLDGNLVTQEQLIIEIAKIEGETPIVNLKVDPKLKMGELSDIQELHRENDVRRVKYQQPESQKETTPTEAARERHFREAIFLIESADMEYTQKRYAELSEKEKMGLLFTDKKVEKNSPDTHLYEQWKNEKEFAIWIDGKSVANTVLTKYQAKDFVKWFQSGMKANARSARFPQPFQVHLYSPKYFEESLGPNSEMFRPRTNRDTITLTQRNLTSMKDLSRYPDPVTAFFQKNSRYEKLKASPNAGEPEVKQKIQQLYKELESDYAKTPDNRKHRLKKPIAPDAADAGKSVSALPQNKSTYWSLYSKYETKVNRNGLMGKFSQEEIAQLEKEFRMLEMTFTKLSLKDKMQVNKPSFPFAKLTKEGKVVYKKISDLTEEEKKTMAC